MVKLTVNNGTKKRTLIFENRILLSQALNLNHIPFDMPCAGKGLCRQCRVKVSGDVSPLTQIELESLSKDEIKKGIRLACLTYAEGSVNLELLPHSEIQNILVEGKMPEFSKNPASHNFGVAVDIGTTTVAAILYCLSDYSVLSSTSMKNPQTVFGSDVITRMEQSLNGKRTQLFYSISNAVNRMIHYMAKVQNIDTGKIDFLVITGNTAMLYLLTNENVDCLCHAPFISQNVFGKYISAKEIGLTCVKNAKVYLPRCISAFVGADITTAIIASEIYKKKETSIMVDIGTNGEIVLQHNGKLCCCSTAAGPAFEGAGIHMGVNGINGAIDSVSIENKKIKCTTIKNKPAIGICGSGIVDAISVLCNLNIIDETGLLQTTGHKFEKFITEFNGKPAFYIDGDHIMITQADIRMVQLAKSAICSGILTLIDYMGISFNDIDKLYIAGGFGNYLNLKNAARIGLIPPQLENRSKAIGNAAVSGAAMLLLNSDFIDKSFNVALNADTVELTTSPKFLEHYMDCMSFE